MHMHLHTRTSTHIHTDPHAHTHMVHTRFAQPPSTPLPLFPPGRGGCYIGPSYLHLFGYAGSNTAARHPANPLARNAAAARRLFDETTAVLLSTGAAGPKGALPSPDSFAAASASMAGPLGPAGVGVGAGDVAGGKDVLEELEEVFLAPMGMGLEGVVLVAEGGGDGSAGGGMSDGEDVVGAAAVLVAAEAVAEALEETLGVPATVE